MSKLSARIASIEKRIADSQVSLQKLSHRRSRVQRDHDDLQAKLKSMARELPGIAAAAASVEAENKSSSVPSMSLQELESRLDSLEKEQQRMQRQINHKVLAMVDRTEREFKQLSERCERIRQDQAIIEQTLLDLDQKKAATLDQVWRHVSQDFGEIFSKLLPGTMARLDPVKNAESMLDGVEMRVAFSGVWKESLTELSGGQRSLLALSFILALLRYKVCRQSALSFLPLTL